MMKNAIIFLYLILFPSIVFSQGENLLKSWDSKIYNPKNEGVNFLSFDAKVNGLAESLKTTLIIPNISKVFFKITWDKKNQFKINLMGLPKGFNELKNSLESTMIDKLRFFIPTSFYEPLSEYQISTKIVESGTQYTLEDKSFLKEATKVEVFFNKAKNLSKMEIYSLRGKEVNSFTFEDSSIENKLLIKDFLVENVSAQGVFALSYSIEYAKVNKFVLPKKILISSQLHSTPTENGQKQVFSESKYEVSFSNFSVK
jgi:hypothetical protein